MIATEEAELVGITIETIFLNTTIQIASNYQDAVVVLTNLIAMFSSSLQVVQALYKLHRSQFVSIPNLLPHYAFVLRQKEKIGGCWQLKWFLATCPMTHRARFIAKSS